MSERTPLEDANETIRGLQETVAAQAKRLGELARLRDIAHDAKVYLIGEHAAERSKRQIAEAMVAEARGIIVDAMAFVEGHRDRAGLEVRCDQWLIAHKKNGEPRRLA